MAFVRWGHTWEGAFTRPDELKPSAGVYCIWARNGDTWTVLDVGESADVRARVLSHDRKDQWTRHTPPGGTLYYSATYTPGSHQAERVMIERVIRAQAEPPCGDR